MRREVLHGEIVGRRAWSVTWLTVGGPRLRGIGNGSEYLWQPGDNEARCLYHSHSAPRHNCGCGLYAQYDGRQVPWGRPYVRGLVTAWGEVESHPNGFRARYAWVAALVEDPKSISLPSLAIPSLARIYGVPIITPKQFADDAFIAEFGEVVPSELRVPLRPSRWRGLSRREWGSTGLLVLIGWMLGAGVATRSMWPGFGGIVVYLAVCWSGRSEWWDR